MKKVLIIGNKGMLAHDLAEILEPVEARGEGHVGTGWPQVCSWRRFSFGSDICREGDRLQRQTESLQRLCMGGEKPVADR